MPTNFRTDRGLCLSSADIPDSRAPALWNIPKRRTNFLRSAQALKNAGYNLWILLRRRCGLYEYALLAGIFRYRKDYLRQGFPFVERTGKWGHKTVLFPASAERHEKRKSNRNRSQTCPDFKRPRTFWSSRFTGWMTRFSMHSLMPTVRKATSSTIPGTPTVEKYSICTRSRSSSEPNS